MNADEYLKLAEVEDRMWYFRSLHGHVRRVFDAAGLPADARVLDAGCGTGGLMLRMAEWAPQGRRSGIDFMPLACELARKRGAGDVREASITALPFGEGEFDAVAAVDVICQVEDHATAAADFYRVLRPGGTLVINVPAYMWLWSYNDDHCHTKRRYTRGSMQAVLEGAGFRGVQTTHWNSLPFPLLVAKRKVFRRATDTSDVQEFPAPIEGMFRAAMAVEHAWLRAGGIWPWGSSVLAVAKKG